ncbi:MAG TPA: hypothetical protein PKV13_12270 [Propionicimonas sp.]|nr:hypothetical protein [Propionicimonas sp.]HRA07377.1 hypothetical protein [Propionicimonas sp.]
MLHPITFLATLGLGVALLAGSDAGQTAQAAFPSAVQVTKTVTLRAPASLGSGWSRIIKVGYGTSAAKLGTSPAGEGLNLGPSYGVQVPNKTWWIADAAKLRLAHYSDSGKYLGQVKLPAKYLHLGAFQWQNPVALADGSVVLSSTTIGSPGLLRLSAKHKLSRVPLSSFVNVLATNGKYLYGFDETNRKVRVNPLTGKVIPVTWFVGQGGRKFQLNIGNGFINVLRPGVNLRLNLVSPAHPGLTVHPSLQAVMAADGKLWILVAGFVEVSPDRTDTVVGLFSVSPSGKLSSVSRVRNPTSPADPADGHNLGIRHGGIHPTLMFIDPDAVRVYRKK